MSYITDQRVMAFMLLFLRFSGILAFFPFFENQLFPISVRVALAFIMSIVFMPFVNYIVQYPTLSSFIIAGIFEITLGFICGLVLQLVFGAIMFAGDIISFSMGLTLASAYDYMTGTVKPIVSEIIVLLSVLMALHFNFHYLVIEIIVKSLNTSPLGGFIFTNDMPVYFVKAFMNMMTIGFIIAFPAIAMNLLSDIIFGMIMKTHPQFNLLVIGFPVKIAIALVVIIITIPSIITTFKHELSEAIKTLWIFLR